MRLYSYLISVNLEAQRKNHFISFFGIFHFSKAALLK